MKKLPASEHLGALAVVIPGLIGLLIVGRTLAAYYQRDAVASVVAATMALVLALGLVELLLRHYRAAELEREVHALPATASQAAVDGASPLLGLFLRARLEQAPSPTLGESIAPYLTGLLVMLGLLGTLFGLFETVSGASRALTASADVSALRAGLSTPIAGLTRSFGCSAAGIGASAMLGLALALVRRREGRTLRAIYGYATGPLRVLAPARRQARALEQLAQQGTSMPEAAGALERVGKQLDALSTHMVALQSAGVDAQKRAFETLVSELRSELGRGAESAATALTATLSPLLAETVSRTGEAAAQQAGALAQVARELSARLDADAALRRREAEESAKRLADVVRDVSARLDSDANARSEQAAVSAGQLADVVRTLGEQLATQGAARGRETEQTAATLSGLAQTLSAQLEADGAARRREASELTREIASELRAQEQARAAAQRAELESLSELATRSVRASEARESALDERWSALLTRADRSAESASEQEAARLRGLDALSARIGEQLTRVADAVSAQVAELGQRARSEDERSAAALAALADNARAFEASIGRQRETMEQLVSGLAPLFSEVADAAQRGASAALAQLVTHTEERLGKIAEAMEGERTRRQESERAHDDHALAALERIERTADLLEGNIAQQRALLDGLVERVGGMVGELAEAARVSSERTLARLGDSAEEQAMRWAKLESELADGRLEHARGLEEQLTSHAERLERKVAEAGDVVRQAAAIWQASSAEMQTIAELFATSVERQREASDAWLESLGDIEAAVERSGRHAAADALADQLASTQEVFARQLQFQRELFEQLRSLRASGRATAVEHEVGGQDVSV